MLEIGGYIEFERNRGVLLHENAIALNTGRNALAYLLRAKKIKKIKLPYFLCDSVKKLCERENVIVSYYNIDEQFQPYNDVTINEDEFLYVVNYYGQLTQDYIIFLKEKYNNIIIDNAQDYFRMPVKDVDTIYTCRKFFGVSDGAFLYTDSYLDEELETDISFDRVRFLLGRYELSASEFYSEYVSNNKMLGTAPIKKMSKLTECLLRGIDYSYVNEHRTRNYLYLHERLEKYNLLRLKPINGAYMYPLYHENAVELRKALLAKKIYIPTLWPNVLEEMPLNSLEFNYSQNILPLPIDQRYSVTDLNYMIEEIEKCIN